MRIENGGVGGSGVPSEPDTVTNDTRLFEANIARKRAEQDVTLLENRVGFLAKEHQQALQKIAETRNKRSDIEKARTRNAELRRKKQEEADLEQRRLQEHKESLAWKRDELLTRAKSNHGQNSSKKRELFLQMKEESKQTALEANMAHKQDLREKQQLAQFVKHQKTIAQKKRDAEQKKRQEEARKRFEAKVKAQEDARKAHDKRIKDLERMEMQLLEKIKQTQTEQQVEYDLLMELVRQGHGNAEPSDAQVAVKDQAHSQPAKGFTYVTADGTEVKMDCYDIQEEPSSPKARISGFPATQVATPSTSTADLLQVASDLNRVDISGAITDKLSGR